MSSVNVATHVVSRWRHKRSRAPALSAFACQELTDPEHLESRFVSDPIGPEKLLRSEEDQEVVLLNIRVLGSKDGYWVSVRADLKPDLKWKSGRFRTLFTCGKVKKRWRLCCWTFLWVSAMTDMDVDAVVGVNQGFLVEPRQASILNLSFFSTQDEHYCEIYVQVWCVTVKQHFQLQLQVILFGQHDKKVEFTHFQTSHFHKGIENFKA